MSTLSDIEFVGRRVLSGELGQYKFEEQDACETLLLGRNTYESFYGAWPERSGPMAEKINTMEKFVVAASLETIEWESPERTSLELAESRPIANGVVLQTYRPVAS